jgi:prepilin-type N-terminal cleavage/methylation domain-containing protein
MASKKTGFTIIELIVVIAIIAVLSAIITGFVNDYNRKAKIAATKTEISEIAKAILLYKSENGCYPDPETCNGSVCSGCAEGEIIVKSDSIKKSYFELGLSSLISLNLSAVYARPPTLKQNGCEGEEYLYCREDDGRCSCSDQIESDQGDCIGKVKDFSCTPESSSGGMSEYCYEEYGEGYYSECAYGGSAGYVCQCSEGGSEDTCGEEGSLCGHLACIGTDDEDNSICDYVQEVGDNEDDCTSFGQFCGASVPPSSSSSSSGGGVNLINTLVGQRFLSGRTDVDKDAWGNGYGFRFNVGLNGACNFVYSKGVDGQLSQIASDASCENYFSGDDIYFLIGTNQ